MNGPEEEEDITDLKDFDTVKTERHYTEADDAYDRMLEEMDDD